MRALPHSPRCARSIALPLPLPRTLALAAAFAFCAVAASAGDTAASPKVLPTDPSWYDGLRFQLGVEGIPEVDFGDADVSWVRTNGRVSLQGPVSERWGLGASLSAELLSSEVDAAPSFLASAAGAGEPLRDLFESTLSLGARVRIRERWMLGSDAYLTAKLEPGAELGSSLKGGTVLTLAYRRSDAFSLVAGVKLGSRLDHRGVYAWPVLRLEWQITERLDFELQNANLRFAYALSDGFELLGFGGASTDRYRLERRSVGPLAAEPGTLGFRGATLGIGFRWNLSKQFRVIGTLGAVVWQRLLVDDASATQIASRDAHGVAPAIALRVQARF